MATRFYWNGMPERNAELKKIKTKKLMEREIDELIEMVKKKQKKLGAPVDAANEDEKFEDP